MKKQYKTEIYAILATFIWGLLAHAYAFSNSNFSHDCLNSMMGGTVEENWKIALGRYFVPLYRSVFRGSITLPWLIGVLGLFWTALAACLVIKLFDIKKSSFIVLVCGIMVTNITYISQIATYLYEYDFNAFALLAAVSAVYLWKKQKNIGGMIGGSLLVMLSLGIYQAYISVALTLIICISVQELFENIEIKEIVLEGIKALVMLLVGGVLYYLIGKVICHINGIVPQARTDVFDFSGIANPVQYYAVLFVKTIIDVPRRIAHEAYSSGVVPAIGILLVLMLGVLLIYTMFQKKMEVIRIAIIIGLLALLPIAMNSTHFLSKGTAHDLMIYAVWFFYVIALLYTHWFSQQEFVTKQWKKIPYLISCVLIFVMLWQNIVIANTAYLKKDLEAKSTLSTMTRVLTMIEEEEQYVFNETSVAFVGCDNVYDVIEGFDETRNITGLYSNNSLSSDSVTPRYNTYKAYFKYMLNYPINIIDEETRIALKENDIVEEMPSFPEKGCIKMVEDVLVVKMGEY